MVVHTYNPSTWEAEAGGSRVLGQPGLHSDIYQERKKERKGRRERKEKKRRK
jgi:hypothetical protein